MKYIVLTGRILYSFMFLMTVTSHFTARAIDYAGSKGVLFPSLLVPLSGIMAFIGAISIILGYKAKAGAWLIVLFLVPVTLIMHAFWKETDFYQTQMQFSNFLKNTSMLGAALLISYFGAGPLSLDNRISKKKKKESISESKENGSVTKETQTSTSGNKKATEKKEEIHIHPN